MKEGFERNIERKNMKNIAVMNRISMIKNIIKVLDMNRYGNWHLTSENNMKLGVQIDKDSFNSIYNYYQNELGKAIYELEV